MPSASALRPVHLRAAGSRRLEFGDSAAHPKERMRAAWIALCVSFAALLPGTSPAATVEERVAQLGAAARGRLAPYFARAKVAYPPTQVVLVGLKAERRLEVYAAGNDGR